MLVLGRGIGEGVMIGHDIKVIVLAIAGDKVRIGIEAPSDIKVHREEVYLEIQQVNLQAASTSTGEVAGLTAVLHDREPDPSDTTDPATASGADKMSGGDAGDDGAQAERGRRGTAGR